MSSFTLREAKTQLSALLDRAAAGEAVEILRRGRRGGRFRIVAVEAGNRLRSPGALKGRIVVPDGFDAEDSEVTASFEG